MPAVTTPPFIVNVDHPAVPPALRAVDDAFEADGRYEVTWHLQHDARGREEVLAGAVIDTYTSWWAMVGLKAGRPAWIGQWARCDHDGGDEGWAAAAADPAVPVSADPPPYPDLTAL